MALTLNELRAHVGEMFRSAVSIQQFRELIPEEGWVKIAVYYVKNSTFQTQDERKEAMRSVLRLIFKEYRGLDPDAVGHIYREHWLEAEETSAATELGE